ncbi:hypothetical protein [Neosynechococcus sphagnicola]|uniref:hypothetical protein n=1 Tax=Neosynechococcus sphagnicola TaxID=1501145 RepID=UPI0019552BFF|nr:hypothetical protein [Neosynechococcus sphagnicola]
MELTKLDDLAGRLYLRPQPWQTRSRLHVLVNHYLDFAQLRDRLEDLPTQFDHPRPRPWAEINLQQIHPNQVIGLRLEVFLGAISGAIAVESPIRGYTGVSWQYLQQLHPPMATFVGGEL